MKRGTPAIDLTGQRYGRLTVIRRMGSYRNPQGRNTRAVWLCRCDCGIEVAARSDHLRTGETKSCGCLRDENLKKAQARRWRHDAD